MRFTRVATAWLVALGLLVGVLASCASAITHYTITALDGSAGQCGWKHAECGKYMGGTKSSVKGGLSVYFSPCKGSPGPRPVGSYYLQADMEGSLVGTHPGQAWIGTDRYNGVLLSNITALKYWAMLDFRGSDYELLKDTAGVTVPNEFRLDFISSQPPQMQLFVKTAGGSESHVLMYRPWSTVGTGTEENPEFPGHGPRDGSLCRMWDEYDCINEGYWFDKNIATGEEYMVKWSDFLAAYSDAFLSTPPAPSSTYGYPNRQPVWGTAGGPTVGGTTVAMATSLNIVLGARSDWNGLFPYNWRAWFTESWNAWGAVDLVTVEYTNGQTTVSEDFDFQHPSNVTSPLNNRVRAMNNKAIFDQACYAPVPRDRGWYLPDQQPLDWWGQPVPGVTTIDPSKMNAVQRVGNFNYLFPLGGTVATFKGALFAVYGTVSNLNGDFFDIDDGSGVPLPCYCPDADSKPIVEGQSYRLVGTPYGQCPYEWYYNNFHMVYKNADTGQVKYSELFPWRFDTYTWNVTPLF